MADPAWTSTYNFGSTPEANGFTRVPYGTTAAVTATTTGPTAGRKLAVAESDAASGVSFVASSVPNLDPTIGATAQATVAVPGAGDAGFEVRFSSRVVGISIFTDHVELSLPADTPTGPVDVVIPTASNAAATTFRATIDGSGAFRLYRATIPIDGPRALAASASPLPSFQFWGEGGGTQAFTELKTYLGGPAAP